MTPPPSSDKERQALSHVVENDDPPPFDQRFYHDLIIREQPKTIARRLLDGKVACVPFSILPITGATGDLFLRSVVYYHGEALTPFLLDTLDALQVQDRLVRLKKRQSLGNKSTEKTDAALAFCKQAIDLLANDNPAAHHYVTGALYPFVVAPSRASTTPPPNDPRLKKGPEQI